MFAPFGAFPAPEESTHIVYNLSPTDKGWRLHVRLPKRVSTSDRRIVIDWIRSYRDEVRQQHPYWLTTFHGADREYTLDILPAKDPKDAIVKAWSAMSESQNRGFGHA